MYAVEESLRKEIKIFSFDRGLPITKDTQVL